PGDMFDPINQEAVTHEENDRFSDGQIIEVVQTGYQLKERVIRPAKVRVAK
ncbi:MAG: nucleotide exchange factor GrpE, partial [Chloroflexi bacterium]|nr:nucleotide exchange factor GrpE [Chloroflexota bacterium]